jgi:hypothetical protein
MEEQRAAVAKEVIAAERSEGRSRQSDLEWGRALTVLRHI